MGRHGGQRGGVSLLGSLCRRGVSYIHFIYRNDEVYVHSNSYYVFANVQQKFGLCFFVQVHQAAAHRAHRPEVKFYFFVLF